MRLWPLHRYKIIILIEAERLEYGCCFLANSLLEEMFFSFTGMVFANMEVYEKQKKNKKDCQHIDPE